MLAVLVVLVVSWTHGDSGARRARVFRALADVTGQWGCDHLIVLAVGMGLDGKRAFSCLILLELFWSRTWI